MQLGDMLNNLHILSMWLDDNMPDEYRNNPLALKWLRTAKIGEEAGEVVDALIALTGGNYRKTKADDARHLYDEIADVVLTGILSLLHHTGDAAQTGAILVDRSRVYYTRMQKAKPRFPVRYRARELWMWCEQEQYDTWLNRMLANVPDCWDDDVSAESILESYLHHLESSKSQHTPSCDELRPMGH